MELSGIAASGTPSYADVQDVIEALVYQEGRRRPIPGMDFEDTAQEIRLECIRVLSFYDASRIGPSPYKYLQTCVRNFLYNQRRGIWVPNNPPCVRCPLWDKVKRTCTIDEVDCDKIVQYRQNMATKAALKKPNSLEFDIIDDSNDNHVDALILDHSIREALPDNLIPHYEDLLQGKTITARLKKQIRQIATGVINSAKNIS